LKINKYTLFALITILQYCIVLFFYYNGYLEEFKQLYLIIIFFSISFLEGIFIAKNNLQLQSIIDAMEQIIIVKSNKDIISANKSFLELFDINSIKEFKKEYLTLNSIIDKENCFLDIDFSTDIDELIKTINAQKKENRIIRIKNKNKKLYIMNIKIDKIVGDENIYVIILTDITKLQQNTEEFMKKANIDSLTQIYSREKFNEHYEKEFSRSLRHLNPLTLLFIDIDYFKQVNDNYGHDVGDTTLYTFSQIISFNTRAFDLFARWGGEEFIIMLPQTNINDGYKLAEKIRKIISTYKFEHIESLTCSIGVSTLQKGDLVETLLKRADNALYKAKNSGRNKTIIEI